MRDRLIELIAGRSDPRFGLFFTAKRAYENFIRETRTPFDELTAEQFARAASDPSLASAEGLYRRAVGLSRVACAPHDVCVGIYQLGLLFHLTGRFAEAHRCFEHVLRLLEDFPQLDAPKQSCFSDCNYQLGILELRRGRADRAAALIEWSLETDRERGDPRGVRLNESALDKCRDPAARARVHPWRETTDGGAGGLDELLEEAATDAAPAADSPPTPAAGAHADDAAEARRSAPAVSRSNLQDVVWLLSNSVEANDVVMAELEQIGGEVGRRIGVSRVAFAEGVPEEFGQIARDESLSAAVLVVERDSFAVEAFRSWAAQCIQNVADKDDFRMFVYFHGVTREEARRLAAPHLDLFDDLEDTVQVSDELTLAGLRAQVAAYLRGVGQVRSAAAWQGWQTGLAVVFGRAAVVVEVGCGLLLAVASVAALALGPESAARQLQRLPAPAVALLAGAVFFPATVAPLFYLFNGATRLDARIERDAGLRRRLMLGFILGPASVALPRYAEAPTRWILLGLFAGAALEAIRRTGLQAQRDRISLQGCKQAASRAAPHALRHFLRQPSAGVMTCPLFPSLRPRVFISYSRASAWSREHANGLHERLTRAGVECFLDRFGISEGSSWRRQLKRSLAGAHVVVAVLDENILRRRGWVPAEVLAALIGRRLTGLPELVILAEPRALSGDPRAMLPVFRLLLGDGGEGPDERPRVIPVGESTLRTVAAQLTPGRHRTKSVFPPLLLRLLLVLTFPAVMLGTLGPFLGLAAGLFAVLERWEKFYASAPLAARGLLVPAYLLGGYLLGFVARLAVASRFEAGRPDQAGVAGAHSLGALGFAVLLGVWAARVPWLAVGWALALVYAGWALSKSFTDWAKTDGPASRWRADGGGA